MQPYPLGIHAPSISAEDFNHYLQQREYRVLSPSEARQLLCIPSFQRDVIQSHVKLMAESIKQRTPIQDISLVPTSLKIKAIDDVSTPEFEVIDGQHRLLALLYLNFPVPVCIDKGITTSGKQVFLNFNRGKPVNPNHLIALSDHNPACDWIVEVSKDKNHSLYNRVWFGKDDRSAGHFKATTLLRILERHCGGDTKNFVEFTQFLGKLIDSKNCESDLARDIVIGGLYKFWICSKHNGRNGFKPTCQKHITFLKSFSLSAQGMGRIAVARGGAKTYVYRALTRYWAAVKHA